MKLSNYNWTNYGDVNWVEHGGTFISHDRDSSYNVIHFLDITEETQSKQPYLKIDEAYVDISDEWIDWESVLSTAGYSLEDLDSIEDDEKALLAFEHYGSLELSGSLRDFDSLEKALKYMEDFEIYNDKKSA